LDKKPESVNLRFANNALLPMLYGEDDKNLLKFEKSFGIVANSRGNVLALTGEPQAVKLSRDILQDLYNKLENGMEIGPSQVDAAIRMATPQRKNGKAPREAFNSDIFIKTQKKTVHPYSPAQAQYIEALLTHDLVFALGPAGTGKTYIAVAQAVSLFLAQKVDRIILSRPAVEAGEKLGFLPGDLKEKIDPYLRPLYDALHDMMPAERAMKHIENGEIEVAPLAFMRGRTLSNAYIILDEAQNTTPTQMKMFLTRMGENSRMVITGDLSQTDLPRDIKSGLQDAIKKVEPIEGIKCVRFTDADVVRHTLAAKIVQAYDEWEKKKRGPA
jgi:phosphate starvation-inducible protein PhoH and related proteins